MGFLHGFASWRENQVFCKAKVVREAMCGKISLLILQTSGNRELSDRPQLSQPSWNRRSQNCENGSDFLRPRIELKPVRAFLSVTIM
jgi:hypothetical protein